MFSRALELLARFELATVSQRAAPRWEPSDLPIEKADEAASFTEISKNLCIRIDAEEIWSC